MRYEKRTKNVIPIVCLVLIVGMFSGCTEERSAAPFQSQTAVMIPLSEISDTAKFYTYDADEVSIHYFVVRGPDEEMHVGFDACDVCYHAKKGYRQNGDAMHCINCGLEFLINNIGTENAAGGCWPSYLPMNIDEDNVVINIVDLEEKKYMF